MHEIFLLRLSPYFTIRGLLTWHFGCKENEEKYQENFFRIIAKGIYKVSQFFDGRLEPERPRPDLCTHSFPIAM